MRNNAEPLGVSASRRHARQHWHAYWPLARLRAPSHRSRHSHCPRHPHRRLCQHLYSEATWRVRAERASQWATIRRRTQVARWCCAAASAASELSLGLSAAALPHPPASKVQPTWIAIALMARSASNTSIQSTRNSVFSGDEQNHTARVPPSPEAASAEGADSSAVAGGKQMWRKRERKSIEFQ